MSEILRIYYHLEGISRLVYVRKLCRKHEYVMGITALKKQYSWVSLSEAFILQQWLPSFLTSRRLNILLKLLRVLKTFAYVALDKTWAYLFIFTILEVKTEKYYYFNNHNKHILCSCPSYRWKMYVSRHREHIKSHHLYYYPWQQDINMVILWSRSGNWLLSMW